MTDDLSPLWPHMSEKFITARALSARFKIGQVKELYTIHCLLRTQVKESL